MLYALHAKGKFHMGYLMPLLKIKEWADLGMNLEITILVSEMEGFLDEEKVGFVRFSNSKVFHLS